MVLGLGEEPGLADAGLALDDDERSAPGVRLVDGSDQERKLLVASDELLAPDHPHRAMVRACFRAPRAPSPANGLAAVSPSPPAAHRR